MTHQISGEPPAGIRRGAEVDRAIIGLVVGEDDAGDGAAMIVDHAEPGAEAKTTHPRDSCGHPLPDQSVIAEVQAHQFTGRPSGPSSFAGGGATSAAFFSTLWMT